MLVNKNSIGSRLSIIFFFTLFVTKISFAADDFILQAMRDEIKRSMNELQVESLKKPYYIEYTLKLRDNHSIKASLGNLLESNKYKNAALSAQVRVGDYKFDNTNFFDFGFTFFGTGDDEESFKSRSIPQELDYTSLRRELWLATDAAYKQSAEVFSKKEATLKNRLRKDTTHDYLQIPPVQARDLTPIPELDVQKYENLIKNVSHVFANYQKIDISSASLEYMPETIYYVNSEGREYIKTSFYCGVEVVAATQSDDGMPLSDHYTIYAPNPEQLPSQDSLIKAVKDMSDKLTALTSAPLLDEPYSGPVLFEDQAAAEVFAQVFAPNLVTQREPMTEQGVQEGDRYMAFQSKIGGRVLPEFASVNAVPSMEKYLNTPLLGHYQIDDEGIEAKDVNLVKDGYLKTLLSSRVPTRRIHESNGHERGGAAMLSVITLEADKAHTKSFKDLKSKLLRLCKDRELPYGIIIRKVMDQNILYTTLFRMTRGDYPTPQGNGTLPLLEAYKIYPNGKEELIRGVNANGFTVQSFKDLLLTGNSKYAMNYLAPAVSSPFVTGGSQYVGASVIVPGLLFEDGEIKPVEQDFPKPPLIKNPLAGK